MWQSLGWRKENIRGGGLSQTAGMGIKRRNFNCMGDTSCRFVGLGQTDAPDIHPRLCHITRKNRTSGRGRCERARSLNLRVSTNLPETTAFGRSFGMKKSRSYRLTRE